MALPSSGRITFSDLQEEFGGSHPIQMEEYYGVAAGVPSSGRLRLRDFHGKSNPLNPITITSGTREANGALRKGYGAADKTAFYHPEAGESFAAFGSASQTAGVVAGYDLLGIHASDHGWQGDNNKYIMITVSNPNGTNPNWNNLGIKTVSSSTYYTIPRSNYLWYGANQRGYGFIIFRCNSNDPTVHQQAWGIMRYNSSFHVRFTA